MAALRPLQGGWAAWFSWALLGGQRVCQQSSCPYVTGVPDTTSDVQSLPLRPRPAVVPAAVPPRPLRPSLSPRAAAQLPLVGLRGPLGSLVSPVSAALNPVHPASGRLRYQTLFPGVQRCPGRGHRDPGAK